MHQSSADSLRYSRPVSQFAAAPNAGPIAKMPAGDRPSPSCFRGPSSTGGWSPRPQAEPLRPMSTGWAAPHCRQAPTPGRSKAVSTPRGASQSGTTTTTSCLDAPMPPPAVSAPASSARVARVASTAMRSGGRRRQAAGLTMLSPGRNNRRGVSKPACRRRRQGCTPAAPANRAGLCLPRQTACVSRDRRRSPRQPAGER